MFKENYDPVLFTSPELENANMTVLHCCKALERSGMTKEARALRGLEINDLAMAGLALEVLQNMRVKAEVAYAHQLAISNLKHALR